MKRLVSRLKKILQDNKEDLLYLLLVGLPTGIIEMWLEPLRDFSMLF